MTQKVYKKLIKNVACMGVDWIHLTQDTYECRALVNTEMGHLVPQEARISSLGERLLASGEGLCSKHLVKQHQKTASNADNFTEIIIKQILNLKFVYKRIFCEALKCNA